MGVEDRRDDNGSLRDDLDKLRADIATLAADLRSLGLAAADTARRAAGSEGDHLKAEFDEAVADLRRRGEKTLKDAKASVEERPLLTMLVALAIGFILGRLLDRR